MQVNVIPGDITQTTENVDAIVSLRRSNGMWGGVGQAIYCRYGTCYHLNLEAQLGDSKPFDGQIFIVKCENDINLSFKNIMFIFDCLALPLKTLVFNILSAAQELNYQRIAIPSMRTGNSLGFFC